MKTETRKLDDVQRLMRRCHQHENTIEGLANAVRVLRTGNDALRVENRELRMALQDRRPQPVPRDPFRTV